MPKLQEIIKSSTVSECIEPQNQKRKENVDLASGVIIQEDMNDKLSGKRILMFSQYIFGYENKIEQKLVELGAETTVYDEMSVTKTFERALLKIHPIIFALKTEKYYKGIFNIEANHSYDYILFIDGEMPTKHVLQECRKYFPKAKICLHMWDSLENLKGVKEKLPLFDYVTTFDRKDAEENNLVFRPLFFCDQYRSNDLVPNSSYIYDLSFIGTIHSDRYKVISELKSTNLKLYLYPYLQSRYIYYFYRLTREEFRQTSINDFKFEKIESSEIAKSIENSNAILDIQHPRQSGLTIRTLEMVGMKKKIVTTNSDIKNYDFYDKNNICVIDRESPNIPNEFFETPYNDIEKKVYEKYSLEQWIYDVLGV